MLEHQTNPLQYADVQHQRLPIVQDQAATAVSLSHATARETATLMPCESTDSEKIWPL